MVKMIVGIIPMKMFFLVVTSEIHLFESAIYNYNLVDPYLEFNFVHFILGVKNGRCTSTEPICDGGRSNEGDCGR